MPAEQQAERNLARVAVAGTGVLPSIVLLCVAAGANAASVVPWLDQRPERASAHPPLAPACRAGSVRVRLFLQGETGSLAGGLTITNRGPSACSLLGWPTVAFTGGTAASARWRVVRIARQPVPLDVLADPPGSLRALAPGKAASVWLVWSNWCAAGNPGAGRVSRPPAGLRIGFASGTSAVVPLNWAPRCDQPQQPSTISVAPYAPTTRTAPASSRLRLRAVILGHPSVRVKPGLRAFRVRRGSMFSYQVAVTNTASTQFRFPPRSCPVYIEQLVPGTPQPYVLNCRPVPTIEPGATIVFAMQLRVPRTARPGLHGLGWQLAPRTYLPPDANAAVWIMR